jgi:hypothetical protein
MTRVQYTDSERQPLRIDVGCVQSVQHIVERGDLAVLIRDLQRLLAKATLESRRLLTIGNCTSVGPTFAPKELMSSTQSAWSARLFAERPMSLKQRIRLDHTLDSPGNALHTTLRKVWSATGDLAKLSRANRREIA